MAFLGSSSRKLTSKFQNCICTLNALLQVSDSLLDYVVLGNDILAGPAPVSAPCGPCLVRFLPQSQVVSVLASRKLGCHMCDAPTNQSGFLHCEFPRETVGVPQFSPYAKLPIASRMFSADPFPASRLPRLPQNFCPKSLENIVGEIHCTPPVSEFYPSCQRPEKRGQWASTSDITSEGTRAANSALRCAQSRLFR